MSQAEPEVVIGVIVAPFGIKGEVKVRLETDFPQRFEGLKEVYLKLPDGSARVMQVESVRFHQGMALLRFVDCPDRTCAEGLREAEIRIDLSQLVKLPRGRFYIHDLVGLQVVTEDGVDLGQVKDVLLGAGNDVYVTEKTMIPAVKQFVRKVDLEERKITVCRSEDLEMEEA